MANTGAGWLDDGSGQLRWWDGSKWTDYYFDAAIGAVIDRSSSPAGPVAAAPSTPSAGFDRKAAILISCVIVVVTLAAWGPAALLLLAGIAAAAVGVYAVLTGSFGRFRIRTRPVAAAVLAAGVFSSAIGIAVLTANHAPSQQVVAFVGTSSNSPHEPASTPTLTPTPTPVRKEAIVEERTPIPFTSSNADDPNLDAGLTAVATPGVNGEKTIRFRVVTEDGVEVSVRSSTRS
jgi:hypothetical protein